MISASRPNMHTSDSPASDTLTPCALDMSADDGRKRVYRVAQDPFDDFLLTHHGLFLPHQKLRTRLFLRVSSNHLPFSHAVRVTVSQEIPV